MNTSNIASAKKARLFSFDVETAMKYGTNEAIMILNFIFWIENNIANQRNFYDGRTWTYNSVAAFAILFPFWTPKQIRRILASLIKQGVLITGNYNNTAYDRTTWYAFKDESEWLNLPDNYPPDPDDMLPKPKKGKWINKPDKTICQNEKIGLPKKANALEKKGEPIPNTKQQQRPR
jgi:hypothetical protein